MKSLLSLVFVCLVTPCVHAHDIYQSCVGVQAVSAYGAPVVVQSYPQVQQFAVQAVPVQSLSSYSQPAFTVQNFQPVISVRSYNPVLTQRVLVNQHSHANAVVLNNFHQRNVVVRNRARNDVVVLNNNHVRRNDVVVLNNNRVRRNDVVVLNNNHRGRAVDVRVNSRGRTRVRFN